MYDPDQIERLLSTRHLKKKDLAIALGKGANSSMSYLQANPTVKTLEKVADYFGVTMDSFFQRSVKGVDRRTEELELEKKHLMEIIDYQNVALRAYEMWKESNDFEESQLKSRLAELETRLQYIQKHPECINELPPLPDFKLVVGVEPLVKETVSFVVPIGKTKKQVRVNKKLREMQAKHVAEQTAERLREGTPAEKKKEPGEDDWSLE